MTDFPHPDVVDIMATVGGVTFDQFRAMYRAIWALATGPATPVVAATLHATAAVASPRPMTSTERSRKRRALARQGESVPAGDATPAVACNVAPLPSLSLKDSDSDLKRERGKGGAGEKGRTPLPPGWQPDAETAKLALDRLGDEAAAGLCFANFRDHFADSDETRTPKGWQGRARKWVRNERALVRLQRSLPLPVPVKAAPAPETPPDPAFAPVLERLKAMLGADVCRSWFRDARIAIDGATATVTLPTRMVMMRIEGSYGGPLERAIAAIYPVRHVRLEAAGNPAAGKLPTAPATDASSLADTG